jgi:hypothetical protein
MQAQAPGRGGDGGAADPRSLHERPQGGTSEIASTAAAASSSSNSVRPRPPPVVAATPPPTQARCPRAVVAPLGDSVKPAVSGRRGFIRLWLASDCAADARRPEIPTGGRTLGVEQHWKARGTAH